MTNICNPKPKKKKIKYLFNGTSNNDVNRLKAAMRPGIEDAFKNALYEALKTNDYGDMVSEQVVEIAVMAKITTNDKGYSTFEIYRAI